MDESASLGLDDRYGLVALRRPVAPSEPNVEFFMRDGRDPGAESPEGGSDAADRPTMTFGMLSTFPPTECGIATFAAALAAGLIAAGASVDVVRCGESPAIEDASVVAAIDNLGAADPSAGVASLNRADLAIIQHEYGIHGGPDGREVLVVIDALTVPTILVAHTVLTAPTVEQRLILERAASSVDAIVVMTETARQRLATGYDIDVSKVLVIAHGAATPAPDAPGQLSQFPRSPRILTWGLLGPGKGIEWAIDAMSGLTDLRPALRYTIAGSTHPKVLEHAGEAYREMLIARAQSSPASALIHFDDTYRDLRALTALIHASDLVVLPYDSLDQVTSGVLVDAVAAGRPVVSTAFPHAVELLASGAGIVVPQRDPKALGGAIRSALTQPGRLDSMATEARRLAPNLSWGAVAGHYVTLAERLLAGREPVAT